MDRFKIGDLVQVKTLQSLRCTANTRIISVKNPEFPGMFRVEHGDIDWDLMGIMSVFCGMEGKIVDIDDRGAYKIELLNSKHNATTTPERKRFFHKISIFWFSPLDLVPLRDCKIKTIEYLEWYNVQFIVDKETGYGNYRCLVQAKSNFKAIEFALEDFNKTSFIKLSPEDFDFISVTKTANGIISY